MKSCLLLLSTILIQTSPTYTPNINDIFRSLSDDNKNDKTLTLPPDTRIKNISIDIENLNMTTFEEKLKKIVANIGNATEDDSFIKDDKTRRLAFIGNYRQWTNASKVLVKNKLFDLMLQTIYMARHKIRQIENEAYYNPADTSYRIGFLYRRIRRIWKKMLDLYTTMVRNRDSQKEVFEMVNPFLILHHKAAKLHVDFLYLWWLLIKLHERYDYRHGIPNTTPHDYIRL